MSHIEANRCVLDPAAESRDGKTLYLVFLEDGEVATCKAGPVCWLRRAIHVIIPGVTQPLRSPTWIEDAVFFLDGHRYVVTDDLEVAMRLRRAFIQQHDEKN